MIDVIDVSEMQRDALAEIFNIGVGRAAASLSQIVEEEIELTAPTIHFLSPDKVGDALGGAEFDHLSLVAQDFQGPFDARGMLVFPETNALVIVGHMLGEVVPPEILSEYEQEAMCEVGNIILNACISALADLFCIEFRGSLPQYQYAERNSLNLLGSAGGENSVVLIVQVNLNIRQQAVQGHLMFLLSVSSLQALLDSIDTFLAGQGITA
jgi:chemotaxis protein CheC